MARPVDFQAINGAKANFDGIYEESDPRTYFRVLGGLDYVIPDLATPLFKQLIRARAERQDGPVTILDLGCSYGINGALQRFPIKFDTLRRRYMQPEIQALSSGSMRMLDIAYFKGWPARPDLRIVGLDASANAVHYAQDVGVIDIGLAEDLETGNPSPRARAALEDVDIVMSTGCVGYVTARTFEKILACNRRREAPWIASFVLRMFPYDDIGRTLASAGLTTERLAGTTFVQRRFHDAGEYEQTLARLEALGIDPTGREEEGLFHAELFVSRPDKLVKATPLAGVVNVVSGRHKGFGRRFVRVPGRGSRHLLLN